MSSTGVCSPYCVGELSVPCSIRVLKKCTSVHASVSMCIVSCRGTACRRLGCQCPVLTEPGAKQPQSPKWLHIRHT
jgi:hypothetical protein